MGFYQDGTDKETKTPISEVVTPLPVADTPGMVKKEEEVAPPPETLITQQRFVVDAYHNATSLNTDRQAQIVADLKGFAEGSRLVVTYYKQTFAETDTKGIISRPDDATDGTHHACLKINGFEMRTTGNLQYEHNADESKSKYSGEAVTYPGFSPKQGDRFIMEVETGKSALMLVDSVPQRLSIKSSTYFKITFSQVEWMSSGVLEALEKQVRNEAWFDLKRFLNEPGALLYHNEFMELRYLEKQAARMVTYYNSKFLDKQIMYSFVRPDGVYDPYVTDFMMKITHFNEAGLVAHQLFRDAPAMDVNFWHAFMDQTVPLEAVPSAAEIAVRQLGSKTVMANSLLNRKYLAWNPDSKSLADFLEEEEGGEGEGLPDAEPGDLEDPESDEVIGDLLLHIHPHFHECQLHCCGDCGCCGDSITDDSNDALAYVLDGSSDFKDMIRKFLKTRKIDITSLHACIEAVYKLPKIQQFYKMPLYIFLAREAVRYIHMNDGIFD